MRVTFAVTMVLFLAPTVYMVKYFAVDKPQEMRQVKAASAGESVSEAPLQAASLPLLEERARNSGTGERLIAVHRLGEVLCQPYISIKRPLECLSAKATLADLAVKDKDPAVRAAASDELGKVAQGGAVIRR